MVGIKNYSNVVTRFTDRLRRDGHRSLNIIAGSQAWCWSLLERADTIFPNAVIVSNQDLKLPAESYKVLARTDFRRLIGSESQHVIVNCHEGVNPDLIALSAGTVRAGGLLTLLLPNLSSLPHFNDPEYKNIAVYPTEANTLKGLYLHWWRNKIADNDAALIAEQARDDALVLSYPATYEDYLTASLQNARTEPESRRVGEALADDVLDATSAQKTVVAAIKRVAFGHRNRPAVLLADRGRGKSVALGMAAAEVLMEAGRSLTVVVTGPGLAALQQVFYGCERTLRQHNIAISLQTVRDSSSATELIASISLVDSPQRALRFLSPEAVSEAAESGENKAQFNLLLVDEAAALPIYRLEYFLRQFSRVCFSTTVDGYEGSGRGFQIRFSKSLDLHRPQWRQLKLTEPIRWRANDPLEKWLYDACLLVDDIAEDTSEGRNGSQGAATTHYEQLAPAALLADEALFKSLVGLLSSAHYRTTPGDIRTLVDGTNLKLFIARQHKLLVGAVIVAVEGRFDADLCEGIKSRRRRVRGHILPQALAQQSGCVAALPLTAWRVMRIAIHPQWQRSGIGSGLLNELKRCAGSAQVDYLGSSFSITPDVLQFWGSNDFGIVRFGLTREASSGCYSGLVVYPLSQAAHKFYVELRDYFWELFQYWLGSELKQLDVEIVFAVLQHAEASESDAATHSVATIIHGLAPYKRDLLDAFLRSEVPVELCWPVLRQLVLGACADPHSTQFKLSWQDWSVLIKVVLQGHSWDALDALQRRGSGKASLSAALRTILKGIVAQIE